MTTKLAGCAILDDLGRLLLIHRNTPKLVHWELPGGKIEPNETATDAAIRELEEELGVAVSRLQKIGDVHFKEHDTDYHYTWFRASEVNGTPTVKELDKHDDARYFSVDELHNLKLSNNVRLLLKASKQEKVILALE